jgi:hypothetical protein
VGLWNRRQPYLGAPSPHRPSLKAFQPLVEYPGFISRVYYRRSTPLALHIVDAIITFGSTKVQMSHSFCGLLVRAEYQGTRYPHHHGEFEKGNNLPDSKSRECTNDRDTNALVWQRAFITLEQRAVAELNRQLGNDRSIFHMATAELPRVSIYSCIVRATI